MLKSMTAFGRAKREGETKDITVELKSVNSRFFDCSVKIPRTYAFLEERIKNYVQKNAVSRAKVDVYITIDEHTAASGCVAVDHAYAASYIAALKDLATTYGLSGEISLSDVARNGDVFTHKKEDPDLEAEWPPIRDVLDEAIAGYRAMRSAEGEKIGNDLKGKVELVRGYVDEIERISKDDTVGYMDKLKSRISAVLADNQITPDESRLLTECAIWADKIAIDEELVRLRSHFSAFYEISDLPEPSGRKLDFLMQEMNREINTIGSKCNNARIARTVVDVKGEFEKIREQVQNLE